MKQLPVRHITERTENLSRVSTIHTDGTQDTLRDASPMGTEAS